MKLLTLMGEAVSPVIDDLSIFNIAAFSLGDTGLSLKLLR